MWKLDVYAGDTQTNINTNGLKPGWYFAKHSILIVGIAYLHQSPYS